MLISFFFLLLYKLVRDNFLHEVLSCGTIFENGNQIAPWSVQICTNVQICTLQIK